MLNHVYSTGEVEIQTEPDRTEADFARWSYTMWPIQGAEDHPVGVMMQVTETTQAHQRAIAMNEQLLLSGVRQHELRETAESLNAQLQLEIADRKRMEQALVNSEKLAVTARFASTMAHEINNPLEAMTNLVYLLAPLQTGPEAQRLHRHARRSVARICVASLHIRSSSTAMATSLQNSNWMRCSAKYRTFTAPRLRGKE